VSEFDGYKKSQTNRKEREKKKYVGIKKGYKTKN